MGLLAVFAGAVLAEVTTAVCNEIEENFMGAGGPRDTQKTPLKTFFRQAKLENPRLRWSVFGFLGLLSVFLFIVSPLVGDVVDATTAVKIVASALLLLLIIVAEHVAEQSKEASITIYPTEEEAFDRLSEIVATRPREVRMCEYSGMSVANLLKRLARFQETESVRLLIRHPKKALNEPQRNRILVTLRNLSQTTYWDNKRLADRVSLRIRCYDSPASLRGRNFGNRYVAVGWYTHDCRTEAQTEQIWGEDNSLIVAPTHDNDGDKLANMFNLVFDNLWEQAIPLKDALADAVPKNDDAIDPGWVDKVSQDDPVLGGRR